MAKKNNMVSVASVEDVMKEHFANTEMTFDWYGLEVKCKNRISAAEMVAVVDGVTAGCFSDEDGEYMPEMKDLLIRAHYVQVYTNIRLPQNIEKMYDILIGSDLFNSICQHINQEQSSMMLAAIDEKLRHQSSVDIEMTKRNIMDLMAQFEQYTNQMTTAFDGLSAEELNNAMKAFGNAELDEEKLVQAFLDKDNDAKTVIEDKENNIVSVDGDDV